MRLPELTRTTTFRWTLAVFSAFLFAILLSFAFVYVRTTYIVARVEAAITQEANVLANEAPDRRLHALEERLRQDPRRVKPAGLFDTDGRQLGGNIESVPRGLQVDANPQYVSIVRIDAFGREQQTVLAAARRLPNGDTLVIGWNIDYNKDIAEILKRGLAFGLVPALLLGLATATFLSIRAQKRVEEVNARVQRIIAGELRQRLPTRGTNEPFDKLATIVNGMLDEIEALIVSLAVVGDDIAHDLRTPLTHVRVSLERGRANATSLKDLQTTVDRAIAGIDHAISIVTALLRIRAIEQIRRLDGFTNVKLTELAREVGELYEPFAEEKRIIFAVNIEADAAVRGDRELLFEAMANLVDNAIKFTPQGGHVEIRVARLDDEGVVRVCDSGPGVTEGERDLIVRRFYRSDRSRQAEGLGLGLSLVAAVVKLHGFRFNVVTGPGLVAEIIFPWAQA